MFKSKDQSRFFNNNNNNNDNIEISENLKNLIDNILLRFGFFKKFNNYFNLNDSENDFCKKMLNVKNINFYD